jgi:hypothetical protein
MKKTYVLLVIAGLLVIGLSKTQAQTTQTKLNQVELMKQFLGTWKGETAKDTSMITEYLPFGSAMEGIDKVITKGKTINSIKELWGYDKKSDKIIGVEVSQSSLEITSYAMWFTSKTIFEAVLLQDISNPDKAILKYKVEFKSSEMFTETVIQNNKVVKTMTFNREKK